jgi:hypothetical protein
MALTRSIGKEVFKTIVEMSYEMAYWDRAHKELQECDKILRDTYEGIQHKLSTRALRSPYSDPSRKKNETIVFPPFQCMGKTFYHSVYLEYDRYTDPKGKPREKCVFTLTVSINDRRDTGYYTRGTFKNQEEWEHEKQQVFEIHRRGIGFAFWGRASKNKMNWILPYTNH